MARAHRGPRTRLRPERLRAWPSDQPPGPPGPAMTDRDLAALLRAAERSDPASLAPLIDRLAERGWLRGARRDGRPIGVAGLADIPVRGVTQDSRGVQP